MQCHIHCTTSGSQSWKVHVASTVALWFFIWRNHRVNSNYSGTIMHEWLYLPIKVNSTHWEQNCRHFSPNPRLVNAVNLDPLAQPIHYLRTIQWQKSMSCQIRESYSQSNLYSSYSESVMYKYNAYIIGVIIGVIILYSSTNWTTTLSQFDSICLLWSLCCWKEDVWQLHTYCCCFWFSCHHC